MNQTRNSTSHEPVYTLTTYIAAPGTPIIDPVTGQRSESLPGHMYYMVSDGVNQNGYGFAPIGHGRPIGPGSVSKYDFESYQDPVYARTIEITENQYNSLKTFGEAARNGQDTHFNLTYNGATNSCIDFTWGALNHAGLHRQLSLPNGQSLPLRDHDGRLLPESNISALQSIPSPFPNSPHNRTETNAPPPSLADKAGQAIDDKKEGVLDKVQEAIDHLKCEAFPQLPDCPPNGASLDPRPPNAPGHQMYTQIEAGVVRLDVDKGRNFDEVSQRVTMGTFVDAVKAGMTAVNHVLLNEAGRKPREDGTLAVANTSLITIQGQDPSDPAAKRAVTQLAEAAERPVEQSLQALDQWNRQQALALAQAQPSLEPPTQDGPKIGPRTM
jgi:hypothetical protein